MTIFNRPKKKLPKSISKRRYSAPDNRFIVSLPFRDESKLGKSHDIALRRILSLERFLSADNNLKIEYTNFLDEYLSLGNMEIVPLEELVVYVLYNIIYRTTLLSKKVVVRRLKCA